MSNYLNTIKELITFYVKTNYENYLEKHKIESIGNINDIVDEIYTQNKEHLRSFILSSMKELLKDEYPGDLIIKNILIDIFRDDNLCKRRLITEIELFQKNNMSNSND